ncbi:MAG TPA: nuclear transport factor 2 family protein [Crinalium sp.]|jgi:ketosteroid isomerase-like protein
MSQHPFAHLVIPKAVSANAELITREGYRLTADDRLDIMQLPALLEWAFGSQDFDAIADLYTDDIVIDHALAFAEGKLAALNLARSHKIPSYGLRHQFANQVVFINENGNPACISYLYSIQVASEQPLAAHLPAILAHLILVDVVRKENGRWKFAHRTFDQLKVADYAGFDEVTRQQFARTQAERAANSR